MIQNIKANGKTELDGAVGQCVRLGETDALWLNNPTLDCVP